ncbi:MAG: 3-hydroxy-3-methylglutaryl-CoA reductase [Nanoarchaeota archaeon]|nr:3-hydroxy-3-methylglutaryl-CoA reductase [Nanoarchaeota archaeon]
MELYRRLVKGDVKPHELEMIIWEEQYQKDPDHWVKAHEEAALLRLKYYEQHTKKSLDTIGRHFISTAKNGTVGIEQAIGGAVIPLGVAGPLRVNGTEARGDFFLPAATNEAALIAGLTRGCKTLNAANGVEVVITRDHMARAPVVEANTIETAQKIAAEINEHSELYDAMREAAEADATVSKLKDIVPFQMGRRLYIRFTFTTGDAMGMNSVTKYAGNGVRALLKQHPLLKLVSLTGNMCTDKKASHVNVLLGRGKSVETEVVLPARLVKKMFGVEAADIANLNRIKNLEGSALSGTISGFNANAANTVAALFLATGQDAAQIVESSSCFTHAELNKDTLLFGVSMPSLEVATVGGGTGFGTAKEALSLLGCAGPGSKPGANARKLAEIIAAAVTAQELNLLAAEAHGYELADSHIRLARGKN